MTACAFYKDLRENLHKNINSRLEEDLTTLFALKEHIWGTAKLLIRINEHGFPKNNTKDGQAKMEKQLPSGPSCQCSLHESAVQFWLRSFVALSLSSLYTSALTENLISLRILKEYGLIISTHHMNELGRYHSDCHRLRNPKAKDSATSD